MHEFIIHWGGAVAFVMVVLAVLSYIPVKNWVKRKKTGQDILERLATKVRNTFNVDLNKIHEEAEQNWIVTVVNILAEAAATTCMWQNKQNRGEKIDSPRTILGESHPDVSWDEAARLAKIEWHEARKLASHIAPQLLERMPYFSEYEPLKSYLEMENKPGKPFRLRSTQTD